MQSQDHAEGPLGGGFFLISQDSALVVEAVFYCQGLSIELDVLLLTHSSYFTLKIIDGYFVISLIVKK